MEPTKLSRSVGLFVLTAVLAACGAQTPSSSSSSLVAGLVPLTLQSSELAGIGSSALKAQGIPFNDDGTPSVTSVHVKVYDQNNTLIKFTAANVESADGTQDFVELTPGTKTVTIQVVPGTYSFVSSGLSTSSGGVLLAYGRLPGQVVNAATPTVVTVALKTVIGRAYLEPVMPMNSVMPGQIFDLKLNVETDPVGSTRYPVSLADFDLASTQLPLGPSFVGLTVLNASKLGSRVQVTATGSTAGLAQEVDGIVSAGTGNAVSERLFAKVTFPVYAQATLGADLERPTLTLSQPYVGQVSGPYAGAKFIGGHVEDNVGVAKLQVYDGVILIASTDSSEYGTGGVQQITLAPKTSGGPNTEWSTLLQYGLPGQTHTLTAVAQDTSGNETRVSESISDAATPTLTLAESNLNVYHLHTGTLHTTFKNFPAGAVQLQLFPLPAPGSTRDTPPLALQTTDVVLGAGGAQTRDVLVAAPKALNLYSTDAQSLFLLVASVNGQQVASTTVTLKELPLNLSASINPATVTIKSGGAASAVFTVTVDPPLDAAVTVTPIALVSEYRIRIDSVGPTTGTGGKMQATVTFKADPGVSPGTTFSQPIGVQVAGVSTGYRDTFYGSSPEVGATFNVTP